MSLCPYCKTDGAYNSGFSVECRNSECFCFKPSLEPPRGEDFVEVMVWNQVVATNLGAKFHSTEFSPIEPGFSHHADVLGFAVGL